MTGTRQRMGAETPEFVRMLLAIRMERGWTQRELASELGIGLRTINRWENATRNDHAPSWTWLPRLRAMLAEVAQTTDDEEQAA